MTQPTPKQLCALLRLEPETGRLFWLPRPEIDRYVKAWNARYAGRPITSLNGNGYIQICLTIDGKKRRYEAHRIVWIMTNGPIPTGMDVDHRNRMKADNRPTNLRLATKVQTAHNVGLTSRNKSGAKGVSWHHGAGRWQVAISVAGREIYLGLFDRLEDAAAAYATASVAHVNKFSVFAEAA